MNYINEKKIDKILSSSILKKVDFMKKIKKYTVNGKPAYKFKDVQRVYNKLTTEYYDK